MPLTDSLARHAMAAAVAASVSFALCPLLARAAPRFGLMDAPDEERKRHGHPIPLVGGIAIWLATGLALALMDRASLLLWGLVGSMGSVGLADDALGLRPGPKLALQVGFPGVFVAAYVTPASVAFGWNELVALGSLLLAMVALANAFNFTDNSHGQCAGLAVVSLGAEGLALFARGETSLALFPWALASAFGGFLAWNYPRARVFLGDCGSHLAGGAVALVGLTMVWRVGSPARIADFLGLGLLTFVPLLDFAVAIGGRLLRGQAPWEGDRTHLFHRLAARGLTPSAAVAVLWLVALAASAAGVLVLSR